MARIVGLGEPLAVFTAARTGPLRMNSSFTVDVGGAECNVAVAAARLGHQSAVLGRVGDDPLGAAVRASLRADGVDVGGLHPDPDAATGIMIKELRSAGRVRISYARHGSAGSRLTVEDLSTGALERAHVVHSTGITASFGDEAREAITAGFRTVRRAGGMSSLDVNFRERLWSGPADATARLRPLIAETDALLLTRAEAAIVLGCHLQDLGTEAEIIARLQDLGPEEVVLKIDSENVVVGMGGETHRGSARAVPALDPVGAGDAFAAGYLSARMEGAPVDRCLEIAMELGRWAVSTEGDHSGLPTRAELGSLAGDDVTR